MAATKGALYVLLAIHWLYAHSRFRCNQNIRFGVQSLTRVLDEEKRASEEEDRVLFMILHGL